MGKNKNCRTCTICKWSKMVNPWDNIADHNLPQNLWELACINPMNKHYASRFYPDIVLNIEVPFKERCHCLEIDLEAQQYYLEQDKRIEELHNSLND